MSMPCLSKSCKAVWKCSLESRRAFDGMHPTFKQVPPSVLYFSIIAVLKPSWAHLIAATYPPGPEPITITSYLSMTIFLI